jgi:hypothetical protein
MGEIPLPREKLPNDKNAKITTPIDERNPTTKDTNNIIPMPIISTFGGPSNSSVAREISDSVLFSDIV